MVTIFDKGKPIATSDEKEAKRLAGRTQVIDEVLKEIGYKDGYDKYEEYINDMTENDFPKYLKFVKRVDELSEERGF
ncbi:MAG: hypothetical protein KAT37_00515 [Candidatus Aenigmarchaeota archaeon]|nr:hypothetical protein [Candidatus Aenigmarchaeota archaeon]